MIFKRINAVKYKPLLLVTGLMAVSVFTWAIQSRYHQQMQQPVVVKKEPVFNPVYDKVLLGKFNKLFKKYDSVKNNYTIAGIINIKDKADSSSSLIDVPFLFL